MKKVDEKSRGEDFAKKIPTSICLEEPSDNQFIAKNYKIHGYEHAELAANCSFLENMFLTLTGELPSKLQLKKLNFLLNIGSSVGPRYPASRAVMNAGVSKTKAEHLLPIALNVASGKHNGASEVELSCQFLLKSEQKKQSDLLDLELINKLTVMDSDGRVFPGFGLNYGSIDRQIAELALIYKNQLQPAKYFKWASQLVEQSNNKFSWLLTGLFASIALDLGFNKKVAVGLFQISISPLMLAFGVEKSGQSLTSMPFVSEEDYTIG